MSGGKNRREELGNGVFALVSDSFSFGMDALLLARFALNCAPGAANAADLGTGCGVISLLWAAQRPLLKISALELQAEGAALAARAAEENGFSDRIAVRCADLRLPVLPAGAFDLAACNPPYFCAGAGGVPADPARRTARAEETLTMGELCAAAARLLKNGGRFCLCHRTERLAGVMHALCGAGLTPKRLQFVRTSARREPKLFLLCAVKGGGEGLVLLPEQKTPELLHAAQEEKRTENCVPITEEKKCREN